MGFVDGDPLGHRFRVAFGADITADPVTWTWTDITTWWHVPHDVSLSWGSSEGAGKAETAKMALTLKNTDGRFTAFDPRSPYWPNVQKWTPITHDIDLGDGAGWRNRFSGFVRKWPLTWPGRSGKMALARIEAVGVLGRLGRGKPPARSALYRSTPATDPIAWWPLEEGRNATQAVSGLAGGIPLVVDTGQISFTDDGPVGAAGAAQPSDENAMHGPVPSGSSTRWQASIWVRAEPTNPAQAAFFGALVVNTTSHLWRIHPQHPVTGAEVVASVDVYTYSDPLSSIHGLVATTSDGPQTMDGHWHLLQVDVQASGSDSLVRLWIDGAQRVNTTFTGTPPGAVTSVSSRSTSSSGTMSNAQNIAVSQIAIHNASSMPDLWTPGTGHAGESVTDRLARLGNQDGLAIEIDGVENFEDNILTYPVTGTWARNSSQAHTGRWSLKSAAIGSSVPTDAVVSVPAGARQLVFWYRVSSEPDNDFFRVLRDGDQALLVTGEVDWTRRAIDVTGVTQVTFRYTDASAIVGPDGAWIDDLAFIDTDTTVMGPQVTATTLELVQHCVDSDQGLLREAGFGLGYLPRDRRYNPPVALTIDAAARRLLGDFEPVDDDQALRNVWTVKREGGSEAVAADADSIKRHGEVPDRATVHLVDDAPLADHAGWRLRQTTVAEPRYPQVSIDLAAHPELAVAWCAVRPGSRVQVVNPPQQNVPGVVDQLAVGGSEVFRGRRSWRAGMNVVPASPWQVATADGAPRVDTDGSTLASGITTTATSLSLASTGALWTTDAADFPLLINVGGEQIRLSAISGTSSPQPATVDTGGRSVNGVVKAHPAGTTTVNDWTPAYAAL